MILDEILAHKREEVAARKRAVSLDELRERPAYHQPRKGFHRALEMARAPAVIAEIKWASPSRGVLREDFDPPAHASAYAAHGATCLSVLTDLRYFQGALEHLEAVRAAVDLPCLRKDFLVDRYQIDEARAAGADAVLVIVAAGSDAEREDLYGHAGEIGLDVLVEVHDEDELAWALDRGVTLLGINNRDLRRFETDLETTERLAPAVSAGTLVVAESGIRSRADVDRMLAAGAHAVLVGEALMRHPDPGRALRELLA